MTREEAIARIKDHMVVHKMDEPRAIFISEALDMAIKALEQEPVLDKIRAEIENHCGLIKEDHCRYCSYCNSVMGVREILEIFDKYKAEIEPQK